MGKNKFVKSAAVLAMVIALSGCSLIADLSSAGSPSPSAQDGVGADVPPDGEEDVSGNETPLVDFEKQEVQSFGILSVGDEAPDFAAKTISGQSFSLSGCRGKVVIVNFWATWCSYCIVEMPDIQQLYDSYSRDELEIVAVNCGEKEDRARGFVDQSEFTFNFIADEHEEICNMYPTSGIPYTVIVGKDGMITEIFLGANTYDGFAAAVEDALSR